MATNFPTSLDSYTTWIDNTDTVVASIANNMQDAIEALEAKVGVNSSAVTTSLDYKVNNFFASGRKLYLYENTAPTGWSTVSVTDKVLAVKGGSNAYNVSGGTQAGSWTQPSHTLTTSEIPSHTHRVITCNGSNGNRGVGYYLDNTTYGYTTAAATDGGTGGGGSHYHGTTYRPYAAVGIIVQKT